MATCRCGREPDEWGWCPTCGEDLERCDCASPETPPDPFTEAETAGLVAKFFDTDKPVLHADDPDLDRISRAAWDVLQASNIQPVQLFSMGSIPSRLEFDDDGAPVVRPLTVERLRQEMAARATWYRGFNLGKLLGALEGLVPGSEDWDKLQKKNSTARPPRDVIQNMLAMADVRLPVLERIVEAPVFGPDGTVETRPGYHASSRTYYAGNRIEVANVSVDPSPSEVARAVDLTHELLNDFPFCSQADRLVAVAAMLGPFVRSLIEGSTPLHLFEAPTPGTGKGLLADVVAIPSTGRRAATITEARNEEEWRKRITAMLRNGRAITLLDNVQARLESPALSAALTSPLWTDRLLGGNEIVAYPVRTTWIATGNNVALSREVARRTVRCRMDADEEHPESRSGFLHRLPDWAHSHRGELVWAALTLVQHWIAAGRPPWDGVPLGSLEAWCRTMGGIFTAARMPGFLDNLADFRESSDEESATWGAFIALWEATFGPREVTVAELFPVARDVLELGAGTTKAQQTVLGRMLAYQRDRWYGQRRIEKRLTVQGRQRWALGVRGEA
jgi:putative DNA primase/helicase